MSIVTNVILAYDICEGENDRGVLEEINRLCHAGKLVHVEDESLPKCWLCSGKNLEVNIAIGAFDQLDLDDWIEKMREIDYGRYGCDFVQLIVKRQEDQKFFIIDVMGKDEVV